MSKFIKHKLKEYFSDNSISISNIGMSLILKDVLNGCYAFEIIYFSKNNTDSILPYDSEIIKSYIGHKRLDYRDLKFNGDLVSIDGGIRYQWNKMSILFIDPSEVRENKIEEIIG